MEQIRHVVVAVPARDEAELVGGCLRSLAAARDHLAGTHPVVRTRVVVAIDSCRDATASVVAEHPVRAVPVDHGCVGASRDAAVRAGLGGLDVPMERVWVANTDADSAVPPSWLTTQVELADGGVDVVVGTVQPVGCAAPALLARWSAGHTLAEGHHHVHGANLGLRASAFEWAGGFGAVSSHEDVEIVRRLRAGPWVCAATDRTRVATSARAANRVDGGFGGYLVALARSEAVSP